MQPHRLDALDTVCTAVYIVILQVGRARIHWAAADGDLDAVMELVYGGCNIDVQDVVSTVYINNEYQRGTTALLWASAQHHDDVALWLLMHDASPVLHDDRGRTALHCMSQHGDVRLCRELLSRGCSPLSTDDTRMTPVHLAAQRGHTEILDMLLLHGGNANVINDVCMLCVYVHGTGRRDAITSGMSQWTR